METNRCICVLYISKLQTTCWKWEMAEFSKISPFFLWNKLRWRVTRANAWKQYEVDREFIISNWFSMSCCKHTPGNILKIFSCKSLGTEPSQTGRGSPWVEWWNPGCVFLVPLTHFHPPHTHPPHLRVPWWQSESTLLCRNVGTWNSLRAEGGWKKTSNHSCQFPLPLPLAKKKSCLHLALSLPVNFLFFYQGALLYLKNPWKPIIFHGVILGTPISSGSNTVSAHWEASPIFALQSSCSEDKP